MNPKMGYIILKVGGVSEFELKRASRKLKKREYIAGQTTHYVDKGVSKFTVFINVRQNDREFIHSWYHEMTHVLLHLFKSRTRRKTAEKLCEWIGYLAKQQFADMWPKKYGRIK